ncbi:hypothetical protein F4801DRAFT_555012 [Xylaria longipes]|nr:hypothetical protein F4801DRAFT_555012 [Xylaria longipes]
MARIPPVRSLQLSLCRTSNVVTALIQVGERCDGCARGAGQFVGCVIPRHPQHQNEIQGVCANHYYNCNGLLCRFGSFNPTNKSYKINPLSKTILQLIAILKNNKLANYDSGGRRSLAFDLSQVVSINFPSHLKRRENG